MGRRLTEEEIDEIVRLYKEEELSARAIAETFGTTQPSILKALRRHGVKIRPRGRRSRFSKAERREMVRLYTEGEAWGKYPLSVYGIAERFNCYPSTIFYILRQEGIPLRSRSNAMKLRYIRERGKTWLSGSTT